MQFLIIKLINDKLTKDVVKNETKRGMILAPVNLIASALAKGLHDVVRKTWGGIESISGGKCTIRSSA